MKNILIAGPFSLAACRPGSTDSAAHQPKGSFGYDLAFLQKHDDHIAVLHSADHQAQVIVSAKYQGKVFTSTAEGTAGRSFGRLNYIAFEGPVNAHFNAYGGENRLWLGPEGAQYSLFFEPGATIEFTNWHIPAAFDTEPGQTLTHPHTVFHLTGDKAQLHAIARKTLGVRLDAIEPIFTSK